jgi:ATP synthase protein I
MTADVNGTAPAALGSTNPVGDLWRGAAVPTVLVVAVFAAGAAAFSSGSDAASVLTGGAMAVLALSVSPLLQQFCRNLDPSIVLGIAILAYCLVIGVLGVGYSLLNDLSWLSGGFAGAGVAVAAAVWSTGHMRTALRLRQPLYDLQESSAGQ